MCGICGFTNHRSLLLIRAMTKSLTHRGPDGEGIYTSPKVSFGHRRLSIIDLSKNGKQPMFNEDKSIVLIFNGEIFNFQDLKELLLKKGHHFKSQTDTEVLVHGYEEWGIEVLLEKIRGFFAIAIWDEKKETLILVRDRIGVKPLYYYYAEKKLFFASEIKSLLQYSTIKKEVNTDSLFCYLSFQASLGEDTFFKGIKKVLPGHFLIFSKGNLSIKQYWKLNSNNEIPLLSNEKRKLALKNLLFESVESRLISDVPMGVLLSGGLDSSAIVAIMSKVTQKQTKTFCVGFGEADDEFKYARIVSKKFHTDHSEIIIKPKDIETVLTSIIWHQDEPLADGGGIAAYLTAKEVSRHVKVVLVGEGGDELFGGYSWYRLGLPQFRFIPEIVRKNIYFYLTTFSRENSPFKKTFDLKSRDFLTKMMRFDIENILPNSLCMKVDKMTSAWGLEAREPFLDQKLAEFCYSLPIKDKISLLKSKVLFRKIMEDLLPKEIIERRKHGFLLPTERWLNDSLQKYAKEIILDKSNYLYNYFTEEQLKKLFIPSKFLTEMERVNLLWRLLIFSLWHKIYFNQN